MTGSSIAAITSSSVADTIAALVTPETKVTVGAAATIALSDNTAAAADLVSLNGVTTGLITAGSVATVTGSATDLAAVAGAINTTGDALKIKSVTGTVTDAAATINDTTAATLAELKSINNGFSGTLTLNAQTKAANFSGTGEDLKDALTGITDHSGTIALTGTSASGNAGADYTVQLKAINDASTGVITLSGTGASQALKGSVSDVKAALNAVTTHTGTVDLTDTGAADDVNAILGATSGIVTGTVTATGAVATLNSKLSNAGSDHDALTMVLDATTADISDLNTLNGKTSVTVDAGTVTSITDTTGVNTIDLTAAGIGYHASGAITVNGGAGADTLTGRGSSVADTFVLASSGDSATASVAVATGNATITLPGSGVDTINGEAADIIDLAGASGWAAVTATAAVANGSIATATYATTNLDAFVFSDSGNYYLAYETGAGSAGTFGAMEIVKIVGVVDANDTFAVSTAGAVTFAAVANP